MAGFDGLFDGIEAESKEINVVSIVHIVVNVSPRLSMAVEEVMD